MLPALLEILRLLVAVTEEVVPEPDYRLTVARERLRQLDELMRSDDGTRRPD